MREIKFRAKNKLGNWKCGSIVHITKIADKEDDFWEMIADNGVSYTVVPETIGQFTGLHDKNGKEIYEGDIVEFDYTFFYGNFDTKTVRCRVDFEIDGIFLNVLYINNEKVSEENPQYFMLSELTYNDTEVIGNIYNNPELLGE